MKVIYARDYGWRKVVGVCLNPDAPEWVHKVGEQQRDASGQLMWRSDGTPLLIGSPEVKAGETGESCHNCHYNWEVREIIFDGADAQAATEEQLWELVCLACHPATVPEVIDGLVGRSS